MKKLFVLFLFISTISFSQNTDSCGLDNSPILNKHESVFLNEYLNLSKDSIDLTNKKIAFVTGSNGSKIGSKSEYFYSVKEWKLLHKDKIATSIVQFSIKEKQESGGYDAIISYWVMVMFDDNKKRKIIKKLVN